MSFSEVLVIDSDISKQLKQVNILKGIDIKVAHVISWEWVQVAHWLFYWKNEGPCELWNPTSFINSVFPQKKNKLTDYPWLATLQIKLSKRWHNDKAGLSIIIFLIYSPPEKYKWIYTEPCPDDDGHFAIDPRHSRLALCHNVLEMDKHIRNNFFLKDVLLKVHSTAPKVNIWIFLISLCFLFHLIFLLFIFN